MEHLRELVQLLPPEKIAQIELVGGPSVQKSKLDQLYFGLQNGDYSSEEDAIKSIYGTIEKTDAFSKLKERLRDRLLNTLFFIDVNRPKYTGYSDSLVSSYQKYAQIKILLTRSARTTAIWLAENLIEYTKKYELYDLTYLITNDLRTHYGSLQSNKKKYHVYNNLNNHARKVINAEGRANELVNFIELHRLELEKGYEYSPVRSQIEEKLEGLSKYSKEITSHRFVLYYFSSKVSIEEIQKKYELVVQYCELALELLEEKKFENTPVVFSFNRRKMNALFNLGKIDLAIRAAEKVENLTRPLTNNWYGIRYFKILFLIHKKSYPKALELEKETIVDGKVKFTSTSLREYWVILNAYLQFLTTFSTQQDSSTNFRLNKFLNDVPIYQKDKQGRNVSILLVQLLFLLVRNDYGKYIDRMDALNQYRQRYLKENNTYRANCIIRMMVKVGKYSFHPKRVKSYTQKDLWKLKSRPPEISSNVVEVEIIPYEHMWEMVMDILEKNFADNF